MEGGKVLELDLHGKKLRELKDLSKVKCLRVLDASCNDLSKIQGISDNRALRELKLYGNCIEVVDGLEKLAELCHLLLHFNKIVSIGKGLRNCHKLRVLRLDHNLLEVVSRGDLAPCGATLTHLNLGHNKLHTVEGLGYLSSLEELNLEENRLKEVPDLTRCKRLAEFNLSSNPVDVSCLSEQRLPLQLNTLKLAAIRLPSLACLPRLTHLRELHVPHNTIHKITDCHTLFPSLEYLNVGHNLLETAQALAPLDKCSGLVELEVEGNLVCSGSEDYRGDVKTLLPRIEMLDRVSLVSGVSVNTVPAPLMQRPQTPSTLGPSLRQVERELVAAEMQLQNYSSEISAKFELLRATDTAEQLPGQVTQVLRKRSTGVKAEPEGSTSRAEVRENDSRLGSVDREREIVTAAVDRRPSSRSGSRARLQEALVYANEIQSSTRSSTHCEQ